MREFLKRCKNELYGLQVDLMLDLEKHKKALQTTYGVSAGVGSVMGLATMAFAGGIEDFKNNVVTQLKAIYSAAFGIITVAAALLLLIAFAIRMTGNQQKAAQARGRIDKFNRKYGMNNQ